MKMLTNASPQYGAKYKIMIIIPDVIIDLISNTDVNDQEDKILFAESIQGYMTNFDKLPKKGLKISNGNCDHATIERVIYNGIDNTINVLLSFD
jgi:hypothetical protein